MGSLKGIYNNYHENGVIAIENSYFTTHADLEATAMSTDWTGKWVLLAGRRDIALQNLQRESENEEILHKFHRNSKHEVSAAEWAICENSQEYCAIATSQLIEVVTWKLGDPTLIHSLRAHTRVVTDIDWHSKIPHLLASCSVDTFTHLWDLRDPRKPILSLSAVCMSGATQVGFNRVSGNLIATAHDGDLRIWDQRKGSCPVQYITAHLARIHGINWSHEHETRLTTASQDGTVKYFDINHPRKAEAIIDIKSPVWRARYTPFSNGLVTVITNLERGENSLMLWSNSRQNSSVCSFVGHKDVVLDFAWRPQRNPNETDRELISWSRDQTLRVWKVSQQLQTMCAKDYYDHDDETDQFDEFLRETSPNSPGKEQILAPVVPQSSCGLYHEFSLLNTNIPHIDVQETDAAKRKAQVKITANGHIVLLLVTFPFGYPDINAPPEFTYCPGTSLDVNLSATLMKKIKVTAHERVRKGRPCLEQCLRTLVTALKKSSSGSEKGHMRLQSPRLEGALSGALHDACVPFPKTSGARFGHVNMLVTFSCPLNRRNIGLKPQNITPRALSALSGGYLGNVMGTKPMLYAQRDASTSALYTDKLTRQRKVSTRFVNSSVVVYDVSKMLAVQKDIALRYKIMFEDKLKMCQHNLEIAREFLRPDLIQLWSMAEMLASELDKIETDTALIPSTKLFAANLLQSLINTALKNFDVQTATMLCCAFGGFYESPNNNTQGQLMTVAPSKSIDYTLTDYRYQLPHSEPVTPSSDTWSLVSTANTAINALDLKSPTIDTTDSTQPNTFWLEPSPQPPSDSTFFTDSKCQTYDRFKLAYADILNRWQLLVPKTQVLKYLISSELVQTEPNSTGESMLAAFSFECGNCRNSKCLPPACKGCKQYLLKCTFCRLPVKGMANLCLKCGHGGHTEHLLYWFEKSDVCASGCGCYCLLEESNFY